MISSGHVETHASYGLTVHGGHDPTAVYLGLPQSDDLMVGQQLLQLL